MIIKNTGQDVYKKQVDLATTCRVSEGTISNWVRKAKENKNLLQLVEQNGRFFIVRSEHNTAELARLSSEAEVFQNTEYLDIYPKEELYQTLNEDQLLALINTIKINKTIPLKYVYLGMGAHNWDYFYNTINETKDDDVKEYGLDSDEYLHNKAFSFLEEYLADFDKINR